MATNEYLIYNEFPRYFVNVPNMSQDPFTNPRVYQIPDSNNNPLTSTTQSISVDASNLTEIKSEIRTYSVIAVIVCVVIMGALAVVIAIPLVFAPHKTTTTTSTTSTSTSTTKTTSTTTTTTATSTTTTTTTSTTTAGANMTYSCLENGAVPLTCPYSMKLTIVYAFYGVSSCVNCGCGYCTCGLMTVTSTVNSLCTGLTSCSFTAGNSLFVDPCSGYGKNFQLTYFCS